MSDPLQAYRFTVTLDAADPYLKPRQAAQVPPLIAAGFQEVSGLSANLEITTYNEGGENDHAHQLPLRHTWGRITLKRGVTSDPSVWLWYQAGLNQSLGARRDGVITLLSDAGIPRYAWMFHGGLAAKWQGPTFDASQSAVAFENDRDCPRRRFPSSSFAGGLTSHDHHPQLGNPV